MGWTNVKDDALTRIYKLASLMGCDDTTAMGAAGWLWRESQDIMALDGSKEEILEWAHLYRLPPEEQDRWIGALTRARLISEEHGRFRIHGNDVEIETRVAKMKAGRKGAAKTKAKWDEKKKKAEETGGQVPRQTMPREGQNQGTSTPESGLDRAHGKARHGTARQGNSLHEEGPPPAAADPLVAFLDGASAEGVAALRRAYPEELIHAQMPKCEAKWLLDTARNRQGGKAKYFRDWLEREQKAWERERARAPAPPPEPSPPPKFIETKDANGRPLYVLKPPAPPPPPRLVSSPQERAAGRDGE